MSAPLDLPGCEDGQPDLVAGFSLEREVDYIADRRGAEILSEQGTPCSGASDVELCQGALAVATDPFRNLLTTEGGTVRIWEQSSALGLFGRVDSIAEAVWMANSIDYSVPCGSQVAQVFGVYVIDGAEAHFGCIDTQAVVTISVSPEGQVTELRFVPVEGAVCQPDPSLDPFVMGFAGGIPVPPPPIPI